MATETTEKKHGPVLISQASAGMLRDLLAKGSIDELNAIKDAINDGATSITITVEADDARRARREKEAKAAADKEAADAKADARKAAAHERPYRG